MKEGKNIVEIVKCITFQNLIKKHDVKKIDLLQIDVEGYDYEIIKTINFRKIKPKIIHYECENLTDNEKKECSKLLEEKGYIVINYGRLNTIAFLSNLFKIKCLIVKSINL